MSESRRVWPEYVSPHTGKPLTQEGSLLRAGDGEEFPIVSGIPRFVPSDDYASHFGEQWNRFPKTQLDSYSGVPISRNRLEGCLGAELWPALAGSSVLEVGCGAGRFTEVLLEQDAIVTSVDISSAVEANIKNFPAGPKHRVAKADVLKLPFAPRQFDIVLCIGVIQHTPNSEQTIARLYEQVRPGGWLIIDHYTHERARWSSIKPLFRMFMKRLPDGKTLPTVEKMAEIFLPWHRRFRDFYPAWFLLCRISPIVTYYRMYPELSEPMQREWAILDTHDSLTDWFKHLRTREQIEQCLVELGLHKIWTAERGNGIEGRGQRPA